MDEIINTTTPQTEGVNLNKKFTFRLTSEEKARMTELAAQCGLHPSEYLRKVATGHKPRHRLTERELAAIDTLTTCKRQLQQFLNRVKGMTEPQRKMLFKDPNYYKQWKAYCDAIISRWNDIRENLLSN